MRIKTAIKLLIQLSAELRRWVPIILLIWPAPFLLHDQALTGQTLAAMVAPPGSTNR